jgi:topoisomerase-4 subunit B
MSDLFQTPADPNPDAYSAKDIEVLEGLEPVRRRPGMYVGGTDEKALHHLVAELMDNAMDEAVAGHANRIELALSADPNDGATVVKLHDNGRGIPVDAHPKYTDKSALEVIFTTLHSGAKFANKAYATAGGLHGVGVSVVNALAAECTVEVARERKLYRQTFRKGTPVGPLENLGSTQNRRGTTVTFKPDPEIFGHLRFRPQALYRMARAKAYLFKGVEIRWSCAAELIPEGERGTTCPESATLHYPGGLRDALTDLLGGRSSLTPEPFAGEAKLADDAGRVEWAVTWPADEEGFASSYCNTVPTPQGGTHEQGLKNGLLRGLKTYGEMVANKKAQQVTGDDLLGGCAALLSVFIRNPQFQGQTKERLSTPEAAKLVEQAVKDHFDHWLAAHPERSKALLERAIERAEERQRKRKEKELNRKTATRKLRLPGKLADCARNRSEGTEVFLVEGDSAGGSAKQARNRETQAVLPLRGKILNVASASADKMKANQEVNDITQALGCGTRKSYDPDKLRYERVIIMCDADVDGAHIASLLMTFFYKEMPQLIADGRLYLAQPPLYRLALGGTVRYARDDAHKDELLASEFKKPEKVEISRFKGLGEMPPAQLKDTTMDPKNRTLLRVTITDDDTLDVQAAHDETENRVEQLMGRKPELRFAFIQDRARFIDDDALDV